MTHLGDAARVIADDARARAGVWSRTIPPSISVAAPDEKVATITASAPVARPAELRLRHPLFGNRRHWYDPPGEKFLGPAADAKAEKALVVYSKIIDDWARKDGYK